MSKSVKGNAVDPSIAEHNGHRRIAPRQEMPLAPCVLVLHEPIRDLEPIFELTPFKFASLVQLPLTAPACSSRLLLRAVLLGG
jgi:hypothetical protein